MSDDANLEEEVLQKHGVSREKYEKGKRERKRQDFIMNRFVRTGGMVMGEARDYDEQEIEDIEKEIEEKKEKARKAREENIEGWLRFLYQEKGRESFLKVMVDTGADVNAITYGMLIDHQLESQKIRLEEPLVLDLAVGKFECKEQVLIDWMGKGNAEHDTSTFYVLPRGEANITHRVILSKEWLKQRDLLYDEDERQGLKPLISGRQSASEKVAREQQRQQAINDRASSSKAKDAYQKKEGQKEQESSSTGSSRPKDAVK